ncbi:MAG: hypothetical protein M3R13_09585 [Armatimonadota bacterium]|nr:hypothetical protein [Armatimonadota bacterium]
MKRLLLTLMLSLAASFCFAQGENPQVRREIEQVYFRLDRLAEKGDVNGIMAMVSPNVAVTDANGRKWLRGPQRPPLTASVRTAPGFPCK